MKVVEVQCVTVNEAIKFGAKRKHDDVDGNDNQEGINIKKLKSSSKAKGSGRPNQGREKDNKNLWEALKAGIQFERSAHQSKKLEKFKADVEKKYPGVTVLNERVLQCECKENVILNKLRSLTNYTKHHLKSCRLSHTKQREAAGEIKNMRERMKCFLEQSAIAPGIEGNSKNASGAKDDDDADSVDSLASGGIDCDECDM